MMEVVIAEINEDSLYPYLLYEYPYIYKDKITLYPVKMNQILEFQLYSQSITVNKNNRFSNKDIIKMSYWDFLIYATLNPELEEQYNYKGLSLYYQYLILLLKMVCVGQEVKITQNQTISINGLELSPESLDDIRRIIILQNDIDFDIDEFLNYDTIQRLEKARSDLDKSQDKATIEDYIDSLIIALHLDKQFIMNMPIRMFWRLIKRYNLYESYKILKSSECSGMVSFKEPIKYWMSSLEKNENNTLIADEQNLIDKAKG